MGNAALVLGFWGWCFPNSRHGCNVSNDLKALSSVRTLLGMYFDIRCLLELEGNNLRYRRSPDVNSFTYVNWEKFNSRLGLGGTAFLVSRLIYLGDPNRIPKLLVMWYFRLYNLNFSKKEEITIKHKNLALVMTLQFNMCYHFILRRPK